MQSARTFARSAPRAISRIATSSLRQSVLRPSSSSVLFRAATAAAVRPVPAAACFSTTPARRANESETDEDLSAKLESELQIEEDMKATEQEPASVKDFLANSPFELVDTPGQEVVKLVRNFQDEKITVSFSIADITNYDPYNEDPALDDEEDLDADLAGSGKQGARPNEEDAEEDADQEFDEEPAAPINLSILIEKPGKAPGALNIDATTQDGNVVVENLFYFEDAAVAKVESPDAAQRRSDVYPGPPFGSLDDDLQVIVERFLEERGVNQSLALFVPDYVDVKEQREYVRWLSNVKTFVDA